MSHDRYFLDDVVDRIFAFEGDGRLTQYEGGYTDYAEARARKYGDGSGSGAPCVAGLADKTSSGYGAGGGNEEGYQKRLEAGTEVREAEIFL